MNKKLMAIILFLACIIFASGCGKEPKEDINMASRKSTEESKVKETLESTDESGIKETKKEIKVETNTDEKIVPDNEESSSTKSNDVLKSEKWAKYLEIPWMGNSENSGQGVPNTCRLIIHSIHDDEVIFSFDILHYATPSGAEEPIDVTVENCTGKLSGNNVAFSFKDNFDNNGSGTLTLNENSVYIETQITDANPEVEYNAGISTTLNQF
jgi:hypothetical protein